MAFTTIIVEFSFWYRQVLRRARERGDDVADVDLLAHADLYGRRLQ